jgi:hypothetical protein
LANKENDPNPEKDSAQSDSMPEETTRSTEKPEVVLPEETFPPALSPSQKSKREKKSSGLWGILVLFFLIIAGGMGAGGYYLYQEQIKFQNETFAKFSQLQTQLSALDTEADQARQNKQSIDSLNQDLQKFKTELDTTLKSHQSALSTLDEDVMRLKEKSAPPGGTPPATPSIIQNMNTQAEPEPGELFPDEPNEEVLGNTEEGDSSHESQKFIEWMENFFAAIWNWFSGLFTGGSSQASLTNQT